MMNQKKVLLTFVLISGIFVENLAQKPVSAHSGEIVQRLKKLNVLGSVLYVAAHPDDENTRLISYLANGELYRTAYLSATRGDGGQNLVGPEIREELGIIRTQELLAARKIDGGEQFFSRANDFGYSKHPDETLNIWEKDKVLSDFVRVIRTFRPDVIITRFNIKPGTTHGHHTTSAMLAKEAFALAGDPKAYPDQLDHLEPWQPKKLFWNTSWWFYRRTGQKMDTTGLVQVNVGKYNPYLGKSYTEIAAESRSMHKSQGFGSTGSRGDEIEYLEQWEGEEDGSLFGSIPTTWDRVKGGELVQFHLTAARELYDPEDPYETLSSLYQAREELFKIEDQFWKEIKLKEIDELVRLITGTYLEVVADDFSYVPGDSIKLEIEAISRMDFAPDLVSITFLPWKSSQAIDYSLRANEAYTADFNFLLPEDLSYTHPYWLQKEAGLGMYRVENKKLIGKPETPKPLKARFTLKWEDQYLDFEQPIVYKRNDPVKGEVYRPLEITPPVMINLDASVLVFNGNSEKVIQTKIIAGKSNISGDLQLIAPKGWKISPEKVSINLGEKNEEKTLSFTVTAPENAEVATLKAVFTNKMGKKYSRGRTVIAYDHFPTQTLFPENNVKLVKLDLEKYGQKIGYIEGAGDAIPESLEQIGYQVTRLAKDDVTPENLGQFDAIVLGIRAFNTVDWLSFKNKDLFEYVENGGTLISQYNTSHRLVTEEVSPLPLKLSRDRVTVEEAPVRILAPDHKLMNFPNKITQEDFRDWVQERGLYFPDEWSEEFTPVLESNDPGEDPTQGGLLVAKYGEGYYIYSGYSWFRELPAGVPGAYRIFTNMISIGGEKSNP